MSLRGKRIVLPRGEIKELHFDIRGSRPLSFSLDAPGAAYRMLEPDVCFDNVLCFRHRRRVARDNTVMYRWRALQQLQGTERPGYAGAVVEVLEGLDGQLEVLYRGEIIPSQEAPPRPGLLRSLNAVPAHGGLNGLGRRWEHSMPGSTPPMLTTRPKKAAQPSSAEPLPRRIGNPRHFGLPGGRLCRSRSAGGCRFAESPEK